MLRILLSVSLGVCIVKAVNPCQDALELHDLPRRYVSYKADTDEPYVCDALAIPKDGKWYKTNGINMPINPPKWNYGCGTKYPIWLDGELPNALNRIVDRKTCVPGEIGNCEQEIWIKIQKCDVEDYVYFLYPTSSCEKSYCFGEGHQDTPPQVDTGKISVEWYWYREVPPRLETGYVQRYRFQCKFRTANLLDIFYQVMWYVDDKVHSSFTVKRENAKDAELKQNDLERFGINIKCGVRPKNQLDSTPGSLNSSPNQFYGIQLSKTDINVPRSDIGKIEVKLTIPFGCTYTDPNKRPKCNVIVGMRHQDAENTQCEENGDLVGDEKFCHYTIEFDEWNKTHEIPVKWQDGIDYKLIGTEHIMQLQVFGSDIWNKHTDIPSIKVKVHENNVEIKNKQCRILNDPHMRTFDGRWFEHHLHGVFVLYRDMAHLTYEVQHQTYTCNGRNLCTCGVAVRSGADVFVVNFCDRKSLISFLTCHEKKLRVKKINDKKYDVRLPSGTLIEIHISRPQVVAFINPSIHDWMNTRGLCGNISNNCPDDFIKLDGNKANIPGVDLQCSAPRIENAEDFIKSWKVDGDDNLFELELNSEVPPSLTTSKYCTCPHVNEDEIDDLFHCGEATVDCAIGFEFDDVGVDQCNLLLDKRRRKRSLEYPVRSAEIKRRKRREVSPAKQVEVNMKPEEARQFCESFLQSSPAFEACSDIPEVNADTYIEICVLDIQLTNTTSWANQTLSDLKTSCLKELRMNNTLKEPGPGGKPSIASIVKNKICDGNPPCSYNGDCVNGTCKCYDGFISPDCSVDLNIPPELIGVRGDSLCDISEIPCNLSFVIAEEIYNTEKLSCDIVEYQVSVNGTYVKQDKRIAVAKHETLVEVLCPLSKSRVQRSVGIENEDNFATAFEISVSYDGVVFSEPVEMLVYDSRCQEVVNSSERIHLRMMDGFCRVDGQCVIEDEYSRVNPCLKCNTKVSQYKWTRINDIDGCIQIETKNPNEIRTIVLATCIPLVSLLIIAVVVGLMKYNTLKRLKVGSSQDFGNICTTRNTPYKK